MNTQPPGLTARSRLSRRVGLVGGLALGVVALVFGETIRNVEAWLLRALLTPWSQVTRQSSTVYLGLGSPHAVGLDVTGECTVGILLLPLLIAYCVFVSFHGVGVGSALAGLARGFVVVVVANELRLVSILVAWRRWGSGGLWVAHVLVGSIVSLAAVVAALAVQTHRCLRGGTRAVRAF